MAITSHLPLQEYEGYLMSGYKSHTRTSYKCVDGNPEVVTGMSENTDGALFYFVEAQCLYTGHCPPYIDGAELTCVVCTK